MQRLITPLTIAVALFAATSSFAQYNQATTNIFAPGAGTNFVDSSATLAPNDLLTFSNSLFVAYAEDLGGDFHFPSSIPGGTTVLRGTFGVNRGKRLTLTSDGPMQSFGPPGGTFWTVSGEPNGFGLANNADRVSYSLGIGPITRVPSDEELPGDRVVKLGFVVCSRTHATYPLDLKATVTFSDGTTESVTSTISAPRTFDDTFYGFTAPDGQSITNLLVEAFQVGTTTPVSTRIGIDDIGFVTESSSPRPPTINLLSPQNGAVHWASNGVSFLVTSPTPVNGSGISVLLNSNNVSAQLQITGDSTNRLVTLPTLNPNMKYWMEIFATNEAGGSFSTLAVFYTPETAPVTIFDAQGFADDTLYPYGYLGAITNVDYYWIPATEPAEIVESGEVPYGKVLRRTQTGVDFIDYLQFPPVSSGTLVMAWDARVSSIQGRTLDMSLNSHTARGTQGPFLMWGTNAINYYNGTAWIALTNIDAGWHHFELSAYVSGPKAGTFDLTMDGVTLGEGLVWRVVYPIVGALRIGAIRGDIVQFGELDNLVMRVQQEPLMALPAILQNPKHTGTTFSFSFQALSGIRYTVQTSSSLEGVNWSTLETFDGNGTERTVTDPNPPAGGRFYRVQSELP